MTPSAIAPHASAALRFGARLDLPDTLAGQAENLADIAKRELVVLQDAVAQLDDGLFLERELVDGQLNAAMLAEGLEVGTPLRRRLGSHADVAVVELLPEPRPGLAVRVREEQEDG